jgi:hypothetical protein
MKISFGTRKCGETFIFVNDDEIAVWKIGNCDLSFHKEIFCYRPKKGKNFYLDFLIKIEKKFLKTKRKVSTRDINEQKQGFFSFLEEIEKEVIKK